MMLIVISAALRGWAVRYEAGVNATATRHASGDGPGVHLPAVADQQQAYHPMVDPVVRLISPFPPARVRERIAGGAQSKPVLGHWGFARPHKGFWGMGSWMRMRRDQGVRARFVADDEVVLEQWTQFMGRLTIDSCRIELLPVEQGHEQEPSADGTLLVCHFFVPTAKQAAKVVAGLFMLVLGLALAIGILRDAGADAGGKVLFLVFGGAMAVVGIFGLSGVQPRARRSQQYVLSWLGQMVTAGRTESRTDR